MSAQAPPPGARSAAPSITLLLAPFTRGLAEAERPAFLGRLERLAAERYRAWASESPAHASVLLACAEREERIADRADRLFPVNEARAAALDALLPEVRRVYGSLFVGLRLRDQLALQAAAERQGADVWRVIANTLPLPHAMRETLEDSARLEEASAASLDALLGEISG